MFSRHDHSSSSSSGHDHASSSSSGHDHSSSSSSGRDHSSFSSSRRDHSSSSSSRHNHSSSSSSRHDHSSTGSHSGSCLSDLLRMEPPDWKHRDDKNTSSSGPHGRLERLMSQSNNKFCADCGAADPKWVSLNLGAIICIKCSGVHRSLGAHITKVYSVNLDEWTDEQVDMLMEMGGNTVINQKYEAFIPNNIKKPKPDSSAEDRSDFIRRKYEQQQCLFSEEKMSCPFLPNRGNSFSSQSNSASNSFAPDKKQLDKQPTRHRIGHALRNSWGRKETVHKTCRKKQSAVGMVEFIGLLKVTVVKGTNLAVRDMMSSDPYVMLSLGHQSVKTRVMKNNLNPVWNEHLMLSIPDSVPPLKVHVFDKDRFSHDDFMGEAEIDIQPLLAAAKSYENSTPDESMQLDKWLEDQDDTPLDNIGISLVDGKAKQHIIFKLEHVESGELEIELECLPLSQ